MEFICIGFLLGCCFTLIIGLGGVIYGGFIADIDRKHLHTNSDRICGVPSSCGGDLENDRLYIQTPERQEETRGEKEASA